MQGMGELGELWVWGGGDEGYRDVGQEAGARAEYLAGAEHQHARTRRHAGAPARAHGQGRRGACATAGGPVGSGTTARLAASSAATSAEYADVCAWRRRELASACAWTRMPAPARGRRCAHARTRTCAWMAGGCVGGGLSSTAATREWPFTLLYAPRRSSDCSARSSSIEGGLMRGPSKVHMQKKRTKQ